LTGHFFTSEMDGSAGKLLETHQLFVTITLGLLVITSVIRTTILLLKYDNKGLNTLAFILYGLTAISVSITGYLGGSQEYKQMLGI